MPDVTRVQTVAAPRISAVMAGGKHRTAQRLLVEEDSATGIRLKYYSRAASVEYWTDLWNQAGHVSYRREQRGHLPHQLRRTFKKWVAAGATTLEAGCGLGRFTVAAQALGYRAEGLDWSAETIARLRQRFPLIPWHVGDVRRLPFSDESFDAVYSPGVCEHFEEGPTAILEETRRILRTGGIAVVSTPCFGEWLRRHMTGVAADAECAGFEFYQYAFTPEGMARLLEQLGFEVLQVHPYAVLDTFVRYGGWHVPPRLTNVLALPLDYLPVLKHWGSTCIWVARKC